MRDYSTREAAEISRVPPEQIRRWARSGLLTPTKTSGGHWRFSFQDLALMRMAGRLFDARVSRKRVTHTLRELHEQIPRRPLSSVRLIVVGDRIVVRDHLASWALESRQGVFSFDMESVADDIEAAAPMPSDHVDAGDTDDGGAEDLYLTALDLELAGRPSEAEAAYGAVLDLEPDHVDAQINLGRLRHTAGRLNEAETLYRAALALEPDNAVAAFNLGVALEDQQLTDAAMAMYRQAIDVDESCADAHFNLARLLEAAGDARAALRHLSRFRRLTRE